MAELRFRFGAHLGAHKNRFGDGVQGGALGFDTDAA